MLLQLPEKIEMWEAVAAVQVAQSVSAKIAALDEAADLASCAGVLTCGGTDANVVSLDFAGAYRLVDTARDPYVRVLAQASGLVLAPGALQPTFPVPRPMEPGGIVVAPHAIKPLLGLNAVLWRAIVHYLKGFNRRVWLLGSRGQWQDECGYAEDDILSERPVLEKLSVLAGAELVVGVPNAWTWAGTAWHKRTVYFYPGYVPELSWWHWPDPCYGRALWNPQQLSVPVVLDMVQKLIRSLK